MCRGFPYEISTTCKKESKMYVKRRILRSITLSRYTCIPTKRSTRHLVCAYATLVTRIRNVGGSSALLKAKELTTVARS